jgi:NitT/TauT family transport system substrate-binding protein
VPEVERGDAASVIAHRQAEDRAASRRLDSGVVGKGGGLNSYDVVGGRHTVAVVYDTEKLKSENPKSYRVVADALTEAMEWIAANKREAAELYVRIEKTQLTADDVYGYLQQQDKVLYTPTPSRMMVHAEFMHKIGSLKNMPESSRDLFFENVHDRPGS